MSSKGKRIKKFRMKKAVRRTIASLLMATALIVAAIPAPGVSAKDGDVIGEFSDGNVVFKYSVNDGAAWITGYTFDEDGDYSSKADIHSVEIPAVVTADDDGDGQNEISYDVVRISGMDADDGSGDTSSLQQVTFGSGSVCTSIGNGAFSYDTGLESITFPDSLEKIEANAFEGCTNLKNDVVIPAKVTV